MMYTEDEMNAAFNRGLNKQSVEQQKAIHELRTELAAAKEAGGTTPSAVDRLRDPDDAMKEAMRDAAVIAMVPVGANLKTALRRIADALAKG